MRHNKTAIDFVRDVMAHRKSQSLQQYAHDIFDISGLEAMGGYAPHPAHRAITKGTVQWVDTLGFINHENPQSLHSLAQTQSWASMNAFVHFGDYARLQVSGEIYGILFLLDDWLSNDVQKHFLDEYEQEFLTQILAIFKWNLGTVIKGANPQTITFEMPTSPNNPMNQFYNKATTLFGEAWRILQVVHSHTDQPFTSEFALLLANHLSEALKDQDSDVLKYVTTQSFENALNTFIQIRREVSGMKIARKIIEYTSDSYQGLRQLRVAAKRGNEYAQQAVALLEVMETALDDFGGLGNDGLSVDKEIIRDGTIFNFIAVAVLGFAQTNETPVLNYKKLYTQSISLLKQQLTSLTQAFLQGYWGDSHQLSLADIIDKIDDNALAAVNLSAKQVKDELNQYIEGLRQCFQATYYWELSQQGGTRYEMTQ